MRIFIECQGHGPRYRVRLNKPDGVIIVESSKQPLLDAARVLMTQGFAGQVQMHDMPRPDPCWLQSCRMSGEIERLAKLTVNEARCTFRRWQPFPVYGSGQISAKRGAGHPK
jgi:hypothetical protein